VILSQEINSQARLEVRSLIPTTSGLLYSCRCMISTLIMMFLGKYESEVNNADLGVVEPDL